MTQDLLQVGKITSTHGLKGEVKVYPLTDYPERFEELDQVFLDTGREKKMLTIQGVRYFKNLVILKFKEINDINDIEKYKGCTLWIDRSDAVELDEDEYYIADLIGLKVIDENGRKIGTMSDVMETGANDVYIIRTPDDKELLIPAIHECILDVDMDKGVMTVHVMAGLE